ncbi:DUF4173 domain-containing protein [bacterium]|nr:MAG: DUF4173 domain-containing protein [bacterium]
MRRSSAFAGVAMPQPPRPLLVVAASICLAIVADLLLRGASWGLNLGLLALLIAATYHWLQKRSQISVSKTGQAFGLLSVAFALLFALRDSDALKTANTVALVFCVGTMLMSTGVGPLKTSGFATLLFGPIRKWFDLPVHAAKLANRARLEGEPSAQSKQRVAGIARGVALALPLLLVFGGLFGSADPVFRSKLENLFTPNLDFDALSGHIFTLLFSLVAVAGLLHALILRDDRPVPPEIIKPAKGHLGATEMGIVLGSLNLLFASFIAVQFRYLFGARQTVGVTPGLSYAEYARGGFFELVWVAALAFVVLLGTDALLKKSEPRGDMLFRWFGRGLVLMVFGVVGSALLRMKLYTGAFGLTELRVYSTVFMVWLTIAFAWMLVTTLNRQPQRFAFGSLLAGLGVIFVTNLLNPEAIMVRTNLAKPNADFSYLMSLSDDALLAVQNMEGKIPPQNRAEYLARLQQMKKIAGADWRETNLSRWALTH